MEALPPRLTTWTSPLPPLVSPSAYVYAHTVDNSILEIEHGNSIDEETVYYWQGEQSHSYTDPGNVPGHDPVCGLDPEGDPAVEPIGGYYGSGPNPRELDRSREAWACGVKQIK